MRILLSCPPYTGGGLPRIVACISTDTERDIRIIRDKKRKTQREVEREVERETHMEVEGQPDLKSERDLRTEEETQK